MQKSVRGVLCIICLMLAGSATGELRSREDAASLALHWMAGNPVMSQTDSTTSSIQTFPESGAYFVYVVELSPKGYVILNSDDRLPPVIAFSADSGVDLSDEPQNVLRSMLLNYCERMEKDLSDMPLFARAMAAEIAGEDELHGPFLEILWGQFDPYNLFCPAASSGGLDDGRAPVGCLQTAVAQLLNYHKWPPHGRGSYSYTDSSGSVTGAHHAVFSDPYDWDNMKAAHSAVDPQENQEAVAELMYELGVLAEADYEASGTGSYFTMDVSRRFYQSFFFEAAVLAETQSQLVDMMNAELRNGFPCIVTYPGTETTAPHAFLADGLMVDNGMTTYHLNMGWGGWQNGWYSKDLVPTAESGSSYLYQGVASLRPKLMAFPVTNSSSAEAGGSIEVRWLLPKRRESEVSELAIKSLEQQYEMWSSDASEINGINSGWEVIADGYSGDCWYSEQSSNQTASASLLLEEVFVPDMLAQLTFRQFARLSNCTFTVGVSTNDGFTFDEIYSAYPASTNCIDESSWSDQTVSLSAYAGHPVRLKLRLESCGGYDSGDWPGIRLDDLAVTSGDWYLWVPFATDTTLASRRFSATNTLWDDCDDFSVFEETLSSPYADWVVSTTQGVSNCFYKASPDYLGEGCHLTSFSTITPTSSTRLLLRGKYRLGLGEYLKILISTNRSSFTEVWSTTGIAAEWTDIAVDLSSYAGQSIYVRLEYEYDVQAFPDGGIWIDSISTQELTHPELEGRPVHYTSLTNLSAGSYTLAAVLTDTNANEHALGPSFSLTVSGPNDSDGDGLPNDWELQYFGGTTNANPSAMAANGVNTVKEAYVAGIDPTSTGAFFRASLTRRNGFVISWNSVSGRVYSVFGTTNLQERFLPLETNIVWPQSCWTDTIERAESYYQIDVKRVD